jgi:hypothetical protein
MMMMMTEMLFERSVSYRHLTELIAREDFIKWIVSVFENRVLRKIFGPRRKAVVECWRKLRKEEIRNLYSPQNNIRVNKSRRTR